MKHCISRRKEIKYHFKREFLVSDASLCTLQQWNSSEGLANQHCKYTAPPEGTKHCHSMDNTGRRHGKVAVGLMPTLAPSLFAPCLSQNTQRGAEDHAYGAASSGIALVLLKLHPSSDSSLQAQAAKLALDWICIWLLLSFAGRACKGDFCQVPEVCGKAKAMQMLNSKILDARRPNSASPTVLCQSECWPQSYSISKHIWKTKFATYVFPASITLK